MVGMRDRRKFPRMPTILALVFMDTSRSCHGISSTGHRRSRGSRHADMLVHAATAQRGGGGGGGAGH